MSRLVVDGWSQVCAEGLHHQCQGHGFNGPCRCPDPKHTPEQIAADLRTAVQILTTVPEKAGIDTELAAPLTALLEAAVVDLAGAIEHAKQYGGHPLETVDEPGAIQCAARFARLINGRAS